MKKLISLVLLLVSMPLVIDAAIFRIALSPSFLKDDGTYKMTLDVEGKAIDKVWTVEVAGGKATVKGAKGAKGEHISIADNVIKVKHGILKKKKANELDIVALEGPLQGQAVNTSIKQSSQKFNVDVGPGFLLGYLNNKSPKKGAHPKYGLTMGATVPDGSYTFKLKIPAAKDHTFHFDVKGGEITNLTGDKKGILKDSKIIIDAATMCANRRAKKAGAFIGYAIPVIIGTAVGGYVLYPVLAPAAATAGAAGAATGTTTAATAAGTATGVTGATLGVTGGSVGGTIVGGSVITTLANLKDILKGVEQLAKTISRIVATGIKVEQQIRKEVPAIVKTIKETAKLLEEPIDEETGNKILADIEKTEEALKTAKELADPETKKIIDELQTELTELKEAATEAKEEIEQSTDVQKGADEIELTPQEAENLKVKAAAKGTKQTAKILIMFGFREGIAQLTCDEGIMKGKSVKTYYEECKKNQWQLDKIDNKINITPGVLEAAEEKEEEAEEVEII